MTLRSVAPVRESAGSNRLRGPDSAASEQDELHARMAALLADPSLLMSTPNPIRAALWLVLLRPTSAVLVANSPSAHPLLAFAEALVRAALNGHRRAFDQIANRIEGRVASRVFETQPVDDSRRLGGCQRALR
jgi:hypothetical protein